MIQLPPLISLLYFRSMINIRRFEPSDKSQWDYFVNRSNNGTFILLRDFMDYHKHRFQDHSLLIFSNNELISVFAAHETGKQIHGHQGLTYGGYLFPKQLSLLLKEEILIQTFAYYKNLGFKEVNIKPIPTIYHSLPDESTDYLAFKLKGTIFRCDTTSFLSLEPSNIPDFSGRDFVKFEKVYPDHHISSSKDISQYWENILVPSLQKRHQVYPAHTASEMQMLMDRFPENISFYNVCIDQEPVAGCILFDTGRVLHVQYNAANEKGLQNGALRYLHKKLILNFSGKRRYYNFGISNENDGSYINKGLLEWKESFATSIFTHKFYRFML